MLQSSTGVGEHLPVDPPEATYSHGLLVPGILTSKNGTIFLGAG